MVKSELIMKIATKQSHLSIKDIELSMNYIVDRMSDSLGESGVGRTHLLQACCHAASENDIAIFYLPLANYLQFSPQIFDDLEKQECVCIDDVDVIAGNRAWEEALFHFYNRARDNKLSLLVSAKHPPKQINYVLPDLQSRLSNGLVLEIKNLPDAEKKQALQMRAGLRGINLSDEVSNYLIHHYSRNMRDLFMVFEKLDQASLAAKRRLTTPFVKSIIKTQQSE